jgi:hypothetical protein
VPTAITVLHIYMHGASTCVYIVFCVLSGYIITSPQNKKIMHQLARDLPAPNKDACPAVQYACMHYLRRVRAMPSKLSAACCLLFDFAACVRAIQRELARDLLIGAMHPRGRINKLHAQLPAGTKSIIFLCTGRLVFALNLYASQSIVRTI